MRILVCDDNTELLEQLKKYINEFFTNIGVQAPECMFYTNGEELLNNEDYADIAFLDVEMPGLSGIHVGNELKMRNPRIKIFIVTYHPDYLDEAMKFEVFRFLSKPIDKNRLFRNLKDAVRLHNMYTKKVIVSTKDRQRVFHSEDIVLVESANRKVNVYTTSEVLVSVQNMEHWRKTLSMPCFFSTYHSYIVNMKYVDEIVKGKVILKFSDMKKEAYLARRKISAFNDAFTLFLESTK